MNQPANNAEYLKLMDAAKDWLRDKEHEPKTMTELMHEEAERRLLNRIYCRSGHDLRDPYAREPDGSCTACMARDAHLRKAGLLAKRARKAPPKNRPKPNSAAANLDEQWRVHRILEIMRLLERNPMPAERKSLQQEFERLQAMGGA
jgi:hypothetical protein